MGYGHTQHGGWHRVLLIMAGMMLIGTWLARQEFAVVRECRHARGLARLLGRRLVPVGDAHELDELLQLSARENSWDVVEHVNIQNTLQELLDHAR